MAQPGRSSEREPAVSLGVKYEGHRRLAPVVDFTVEMATRETHRLYGNLGIHRG